MRTTVRRRATFPARSGACAPGLAVLALALCAQPTSASAKLVKYMEDATLFGTLSQKNTNCPNVNCGPTSAVNSFVYLQNAFPNVYKTPLVPTNNGKKPSSDEQKAVANTLGTDYMKNCCDTRKEGTAIGDFILGKMDYIESRDKGVTTYAAQIAGRWTKVIPNHPSAAKPSYVQDQTPPTLGFIAAQLQGKEDVEILLDNNDGKVHYLTLTGISYDDANNMGTFYYVDPDDGGRGQNKILGLGEDKFIQTDYMLNDVNTEIVGVVSESPVPEPGTWLLLGAGVALLGPALRRRRANGFGT